uniref:WGS project CBMI000000000 data, contig CS3069_c002831 n=1 Tax=Fusarium clavum TaxID=2594811 RepID=A0A090MJ81_9HYPO|nr:unnamed protein product [Fusarium clavum]
MWNISSPSAHISTAEVGHIALSANLGPKRRALGALGDTEITDLNPPVRAGIIHLRLKIAAGRKPAPSYRRILAYLLDSPELAFRRPGQAPLQPDASKAAAAKLLLPIPRLINAGRPPMAGLVGDLINSVLSCTAGEEACRQLEVTDKVGNSLVFQVLLICCIKFIVQTCENYRAADAEVAERVAIVENTWTRARIQVDFIEPLGPILDAEHRRVLEDIIGILVTKLSSAVRKLDSVLSNQENGAGRELRLGWFRFSRGVRRGKYAFVKNSLDKVIQDMEEWQRRFDPSWFLIMRIANPIIDQKLTRQHQRVSQESQAGPFPAEHLASSSSSQQQPDQHNQSFTLATRLQTAPSPLSLADGLRTAFRPDGPHRSVFLPRTDLDFLPIPYCNARAACRRGSSDRWFLVDRLTCQPMVDVNVMESNIRTLAQKLTHADPLTFNLFQCKGVMHITNPSRPSYILAFDLVFFLPDGMEIPQSLR